MEQLLYGMLLYQYVDVEKIKMDDALLLIDKDVQSKTQLLDSYKKIKQVLDLYEFQPRGRR